jgi:PAS domain S-box-containing protein
VASESSLAQQIRAGWPRIGEILDTLAEAVTIRDRDGTIAYANRAALASMGFGSLAELQARSSQAIMADYLVEDEFGNPLTLQDVPSVRLMRGGSAAPLLMRTVHRQTGELHWRQLKATPLLDDRGEPVAAVTVIEDVTAVKTAEIRTRLLAESGRTLASTLDYQKTLDNVANLAVPVLADWCVVDLIDAGLRREHSVVAHPDAGKLALAARLRELEPNELDPEGTAAQVIRTGRSALFARVTDEQLAQGTSDPERLRLLRELQLRSVIIVPMRVPTRTIGVMTLVTAESRRELGQDDLELAEQLARRAAVAAENARLHTALSGVASTLQQSLLPDELPEIPGWEIAALYRPAGGRERIDVGGDFYEFIPTAAGWLAIIGDVTGKGVAAAALTGLLRHGSRFASRYDPRPGAILRELDQALRNRSGDSLCTALCVRLTDNRVTLSSAGHPPALLRRTDGRIEETPAPGPLLGAFPDAGWPEETVAVAPSETLLLFTDGVTEAAGRDDRFGLDRLKALFAEHSASAPQQLLAGLEAALERFRAGEHADDVAAIALRPRT